MSKHPEDGASGHSSHEERTAAAPRESSLHAVTVNHIGDVGNVRRLRLDILDRQRGIKFLPGQWLDVYIPDPEIPKPGGFTITSEPRLARGLSQQLEEQKLSANQDQTSSPTGNPCLHVAVQNAPSNPAAAWLCQEPLQKILGKTLQVRVGGSFVWPPSHKKRPRAVIMIAGGVGINPFMSMISHLFTPYTADSCPPDGNDSVAEVPRVTLMYGTRQPASRERMPLFMGELQALAKHESLPFRMEWYAGENRISNDSPLPNTMTKKLDYQSRRMTLEDVRRVSRQFAGPEGTEEARDLVFYVCGPKSMTDEFVEGIKRFEGVREEDVLCEKWW